MRSFLAGIYSTSITTARVLGVVISVRKKYIIEAVLYFSLSRPNSADISGNVIKYLGMVTQNVNWV